MGRDRPPLKLHDKGPPIDFAPIAARVQGLIRRASEIARGDDQVWDIWITRHLGSPNGALNAIAGLPMATDAFMRGLQAGLKAHIPIESEQFAEKRREFSALISKAMIRYASVDAATNVISKDAKAVLEAVSKAEMAFKRLEELPTAPPSEHPLVKAQRVLGEKIVNLRAGKNQPPFPGQEEVVKEFDRLHQLYQEMFGTVFPG